MKDNELKIMVPNDRSFAVEDIFKLVRASELSLSDDFLKHIPKNPVEEKFKEAVKAVIEVGVKNFYRPTIDPSFDGDGRICYQAGRKPVASGARVAIALTMVITNRWPVWLIFPTTETLA